MNLKIITLYLPQFHPIAENDKWWGKGFTEWTNVAKANPLFKNHYQPKLPADLGFYDLRLPEARIAQTEMAKAYGIHGFCYYHYWFKGHRLIERPFEEVLKTGKPDFPFMLCWANETWSRRWLGEEKEILIKQEYSKEDDIEHANYLIKAFADSRYITVDGRPFFIIYRPNDLPDPASTLRTLKGICKEKLSVEPYIAASNTRGLTVKEGLSLGFDAIFNFRPALGALPFAFGDGWSYKRSLYNFRKHKSINGNLKIYDYEEALKLMEKIEPENYDHVIPSAFVDWDNTARRGRNGIVIKNSTPDLFKKELLRIKLKLQKADENPGFIFINGWNEWAEGNYLEPDQKNGKRYLEAVKSITDIR